MHDGRGFNGHGRYYGADSTDDGGSYQRPTVRDGQSEFVRSFVSGLRSWAPSGGKDTSGDADRGNANHHSNNAQADFAGN